MAFRPQPAGPRTLRALYHWVWRGLTGVGESIGGDLPTDPPTPVPPTVPGAHSHYLDNLVNVDIATQAHRNSLSLDTATGLWNADSRSKTFIQSTAPLDSESSAGDLWVVVPP